MKMGGAAVVVSASILLSRLLGLGRETLLASLLGIRPEGDLYRQAFTIPDFLNYLLAGAYLTITLIPILSRHLERGQTEKASQAFTSVFRFVALAILGLTVVMWLAADPLVSLIFPRASDHARLVSLTRLVIPAQVFLVLGALLMAVQYTHRRFLYPALAPLVYNVAIIAGGLIGAATGEASPEAFLWGAVVGSAVGNFGLQWFGARSTGTWFTSVPRDEPSVKEYLILALPLMLGQSIAVLDEQFVRWFGQIEDGATSALSFARQLNMVPIGVIAQAAGVAAFPFLARLAAAGDDEGLDNTTVRALRNTFFVASVATAALIVLARPLVRLLFQYGRFTADDAELVAGLLTLYAFSIPAWGLHQILSRHFYAKRMMWTVVLIGTAGTIVAIPTWLGLHSAMGVEGFALASTLVMTAYAAALLVAMGVDSGWEPVRRLLPSIGRAVVAGAAAILVSYPLVQAMLGEGPVSLFRGLVVAAIGGLTTLAGFLGVAYLLKSPELGELRRRRRAGPGLGQG